MYVPGWCTLWILVNVKWACRGRTSRSFNIRTKSQSPMESALATIWLSDIPVATGGRRPQSFRRDTFLDLLFIWCFHHHHPAVLLLLLIHNNNHKDSRPRRSLKGHREARSTNDVPKKCCCCTNRVWSKFEFHPISWRGTKWRCKFRMGAISR